MSGQGFIQNFDFGGCYPWYYQNAGGCGHRVIGEMENYWGVGGGGGDRRSIV